MMFSLHLLKLELR